ncbi:unnamed protein product [Sphagnum compactum]
MHLVSGSETYKTASGVITQALGRISEVPIKVGGVQCSMTFMVVDMDSYDVLLGLDLLIKIGAIVDVEQGLIQVRRGPETDVEILPLTMVNLIQWADSRTDGRDKDGAHERAPGNLDAMDGSSSLSQQATREQVIELDSESDSDSSRDSDNGTQPVGHEEGESEFGDTDLENLVLLEGAQQILQLTMQNKADDLLKEELTDANDYADWIQWAADEEERMQSLSEVANAVQEAVLLQIQQMELVDSDDCVKERIMKNPKEDTRWGEILGQALDDEDFHQEIKDDPHTQHGVVEMAEKVLSVRPSQHVEWHGNRRQGRRRPQVQNG